MRGGGVGAGPVRAAGQRRRLHNHAPTATANTNTIAEDAVAPVTGNVLSDDDGFGVDSDLDGDSLTVSGVTGGDAYGTLSWNADGSYSYAIDNTNPTVQALGVTERSEERFSRNAETGCISRMPSSA